MTPSSPPSRRAPPRVQRGEIAGETAGMSGSRPDLSAVAPAPPTRLLASSSTPPGSPSLDAKGKRMLASSPSSPAPATPSRDRRVVFVYALLFLDVIIIGSTSAQHSFNPASLIDKVLLTHASFPSAPSLEADAADLPFHRLLPHSVKRELGLACVCGWAALVVLGILTLLCSTSSPPVPLLASAYGRRTAASEGEDGGVRKAGSEKTTTADFAEERGSRGKKSPDKEEGGKRASKETGRSRVEAGVAAAVETKFREYEQVVLSQYADATLTQVKMRSFFIALATLLVFFIINFILQINVQCHRTKHQLSRMHALAAEVAEHSEKLQDVRANPAPSTLHALDPASERFSSDSASLVKIAENLPSLPGQSKETRQALSSTQGEAASPSPLLGPESKAEEAKTGETVSETEAPLPVQPLPTASHAEVGERTEKGEDAEEPKVGKQKKAEKEGFASNHGTKSPPQDNPPLIETQSSSAPPPSFSFSRPSSLESDSDLRELGGGMERSEADDSAGSQEAPRSPSYVYYRDFWFWRQLLASCLQDAELQLSVAWIAMHVAGTIFCMHVTRDVTESLKATVEAFRLL
ncbi:putative transmembrane protein [Toxoplasma gondii MAS]|uniref:Putative transmembrane protein n=1 Tax=Toxoplasma gondii MAS TaxID=943118 RepID=A0A086Q8M5_TOXGO|nr:putative transmembrane protein [Toxoplasma gondii MAS]